MISVIIIDDHPLVLNGFEFILHNHTDISLLKTFTRADEALLFLQHTTVDVALVDINMPGMNGIELTTIIKKQQAATQVIAISNINEGSIVRRMMDVGASGYLLKNVSASELISSIHRVLTGDRVYSAEIEAILDRASSAIPKITQRENQVLKLMAEGKTTPQIAEVMFISPLTVESHRRNLLQKFNVSNSASLIHQATEMKFI